MILIPCGPGEMGSREVATGFCSSVPRAGGTPDRKRLGDWQGIRDSAKVGRRLGSAAEQVEMEDKAAAG